MTDEIRKYKKNEIVSRVMLDNFINNGQVLILDSVKSILSEIENMEGKDKVNSWIKLSKLFFIDLPSVELPFEDLKDKRKNEKTKVIQVLTTPIEDVNDEKIKNEKA